jgi:hypothetical protein
LRRTFGATQFRDDVGAEGETGQGIREMGIAGAKPGERGASVFQTLGEAGLAKIEAEGHGTRTAERARNPMNHFIV